MSDSCVPHLAVAAHHLLALHVCTRVPWLLYTWHDSFRCDMTSLHMRDDILQKRPIIWRSLLIVATPCDTSAMCIKLYFIKSDKASPYAAWLVHMSHIFHMCHMLPSLRIACRKIIGLFCKRALPKRLYSAKETYNFQEPSDQSHPIARRGGLG